jgi:uncharacterized protein DUF6983
LIDINLQPIPNQSLSIRLDDNLYDITVKEARGVMSFTLVRNDIPIVSGLRMLPNAPLIPYRYLEAGNFVMLCDNEEYPFYTDFGDSQSLVYLSDAEIAVIRA